MNISDKISKGKLTDALELIKTYPDIDIKSKNTFLMNIYLLQHNFDLAEEHLNKNKCMKRDYLNFISYIYFINFDKALYYFKFVKSVFKILDKDLTFLLQHKMFNLIVFLNHYKLKICCDSNCSNPPVKLIEPDVSGFLDKIKINFKYELCKNKNYDCVIDAANIIMNNGKPNHHKLLHIIITCQSVFKNVLVILYHKYDNQYFRNILKKNNLQCDIFKTPYYEYDDNYILYYAIKYNVKIVSNDNYKDFIFKLDDNDKNFNNLELFLQNNIIKYDFSKNLLIFPKTYTECIQISENNIFIPCNNGFYKLLT